MKSHLIILALSTSLLAACGDNAQRPPDAQRPDSKQADAQEPDVLALPGSSYYPESLHASADGTLYVGSLATGQITAYDDGATTPRTVLAAGASGVTGEAGVFVHGDELWICSIDTTFQQPTQLKHFDLQGTLVKSYTLGAMQFCNDIAFDPAGNIYLSDSFGGTIQRLQVGASALDTFATDARFAPATQGAFGLDGIVFDGANGLYVNNVSTGKLFRVALANAAVTPITVTPALSGPDGMRLLDANTLLVVEGQANQLSKVTITANTATSVALKTGLDMPTAVVVARGSAWVTEGQLGRLFAQPPQQPNLPFAIRRVAL
jgi:streptogramin lyase